MGVTRFRGPIIVIRAAVLLLCLFGLAGCPGPSSSSAAGPPLSSVLGPPPSPTQSCFAATSAYVRRARGTAADGHAVLTAVRAPGWEVPEPDVNIDTTRQDGQDQQAWADDGIHNARSVAQPQSGLAPNEANLLTESNEVVATEDTTLLQDDLNRLGTDPNYADEICSTLDVLNKAIQAATIDPTNVPQVVSYVQSLTFSNGSTAPNDLGAVFQDAADKFNSAFPQCGSTLDTVQWIIEQIQKLFCPQQ